MQHQLPAPAIRPVRTGPQSLPAEVSIDRVPQGEIRDEDFFGPKREGQIIYQQCGGGRRILRKRIHQGD